MVQQMKNVALLNQDLTIEERNLLSVGYKNIIGARRASWRIISSIEQKEESRKANAAAAGAAYDDSRLNSIKMYRLKVEGELNDICSDILGVLSNHLIKSASTGESRVFYYKM